jgi:hypothetical protein
VGAKYTGEEVSEFVLGASLRHSEMNDSATGEVTNVFEINATICRVFSLDVHEKTSVPIPMEIPTVMKSRKRR